MHLSSDDGHDCDTSTTLDGAQMLETDSGIGLVATANPGKAPVYIHVDNSVLAAEGARTFEQDSTVVAWAQWRCTHVEVAQIFLITTSSIQFYLGMITSYAVTGIFPLVSSIFGLVTAIQYFRGDVSSLEKTLNRVRLPAALAGFHCNRRRIDSFFLRSIPCLNLFQRIVVRAVCIRHTYMYQAGSKSLCSKGHSY
jgi:hypothetical protein